MLLKKPTAVKNFARFKVMSFYNYTKHHVKCALKLLQSQERSKLNLTNVDTISPGSLNSINTPPGLDYKYSQLPDIIPTTTTILHSDSLPTVSISGCETVPRSSVVTSRSGGGSGFRIRQSLETSCKPTVSDSTLKPSSPPEEAPHQQIEIELQLKLSEYQETMDALDMKLKEREQQQLTLQETMDTMTLKINQLQQEMDHPLVQTHICDEASVGQTVEYDIDKQEAMHIHKQVPKRDSCEELLLQSVQKLQQLISQSLVTLEYSADYSEHGIDHQPHHLEYHDTEPQKFSITHCPALPPEVGNDLHVISEEEEIRTQKLQTDEINQQSTPLTVPIIDNQDISGILKMHKMKLLSSTVTKFNGEESEYQGFKCQFSTLIDSMDISDQDKGLILFMSLEDEVINTLGTITGEHIDYHKLWKNLDDEYLTPQNGIFSHFVALNSISTWTTCDTLSQLEKLYKFARLHFLALRRLEADIQAEGFSVVLLSKLTGTTGDRVSSLMAESNGKPVLSSILEIMREQIHILKLQEEAAKWHQTVPNRNEVYQSTPHYQTNELRDTTAHAQALELKCVFCLSSGHDSTRCRRYRMPSDFQRELYKQYRCFNCMEQGHHSSDCPRVKMCSLCGDSRKHSPPLCKHYYA